MRARCEGEEDEEGRGWKGSEEERKKGGVERRMRKGERGKGLGRE